MTRYTPERGYGLDLSGPEPVWRGKRPRWSRSFAAKGYIINRRSRHMDRIDAERQGMPLWLPRYRIDEYVQRGLIDRDSEVWSAKC